MDYIVTVQVRYAIRAEDSSIAYEIALEKAKELAPVVGDFGAFETEASEEVSLDFQNRR